MSILGITFIVLALVLLFGRIAGRRGQQESQTTIIFIRPWRLLFLSLFSCGTGGFLIWQSYLQGIPAMAVGGILLLVPSLWIAVRSIRFMFRGFRVFFHG